MIDKKIIINSLKGKTNEEKIEEIEERMFYINMIDHWSKEDYELMDVLYEIKVELERKNNNEWKKWNNSIGTIANN